MIVKGDTKCFDRTGYRNGRASDINRRDWWEMSNMITLSTLPIPEIDLSMTLKVIEKL